MILFEVANILPAGAGSDQADVPVDVSAFTNLGDAVQVRTRYGRIIWPV